MIGFPYRTRVVEQAALRVDEVRPEAIVVQELSPQVTDLLEVDPYRGGRHLLVVTNDDDLSGEILQEDRFLPGLRGFIHDHDIEDLRRNVNLLGDSIDRKNPYWNRRATPRHSVPNLGAPLGRVLTCSFAEAPDESRVRLEVGSGRSGHSFFRQGVSPCALCRDAFDDTADLRIDASDLSLHSVDVGLVSGLKPRAHACPLPRRFELGDSILPV